MKRLLCVILLASINSFAFYFDVGFGFGGASTEIDNRDFGDACGSSCDELAVNLGIRIGGAVSNNFWIAGELSGLGNRYYDSDNYLQFNSYMIGPSFIYYPVDHFHLSGSIGFSWTSNVTDIPGFYAYDGTGASLSLTAAYDTGIENGALIGAKIYASSVTLDESNADETTVGFVIFVGYVHK